MSERISIAVVGCGFVGEAVQFGFNTANVDLTLIDPKVHGNKLEDYRGKKFRFIFVCVPTPMGNDHKIDSKILDGVMSEIKGHHEKNLTVTIIKSTVTPDILTHWDKQLDNLVYNPEFLTERNAKDDFINPIFHVFGGSKFLTGAISELYNRYSRCDMSCPVFHVSIQEASFIKYSMNNYLASKVIWFNEFKELCDVANINFDAIVKALGADPRIGNSHMLVPGFDGKRGFGLGCFPKDTAALYKYAKSLGYEFEIVKHIIRKNNEIRSKLPLDSREVEQNVKFDNQSLFG